MKDRVTLLTELLVAARPVEQIAQELAAFGWDSDEELVVLTRAHANALLNRFISGASSAESIRAWAETIEGRDDVGFESDAAEILKQVIFELANPEVTRPLTHLTAQKLLGDLRK